MDKTAVSVLVPNYNQGRFFGGLLSCLLKQTVLPQEIVIVDDKSTDNSIELINKELKAKQNEIAAKNISINFIKREKNGGLSACRNTGISSITNPIIALNDMDDFYYPDKIKKSIAILDKFPSVDVVYSDYDVQDLSKNTSRREFKHPYDARYLMQSCIVSTNSVLRRSFYDKIGMYSEKYSVAEDYYLWLKAMKVGVMFYHIPEPLFCYRENHGSNITQNRQHEMMSNIQQYRKELFGA